MTGLRKLLWIAAAAVTVALVATAGWAIVSQAPAIAAGALLHPWRRPLTTARPAACADAAFEGDGVTLQGWSCPARGGRRGTVVFLHGVADNRAGVTGVFERFTARGFDVVAYDSRAHGQSGGEMCTYGYYERRDLSRVLDVLGPGPVVLIGGSLGGAVALQAAAIDRRITAVVAAEVFSDLETVARERAPFFLTDGLIRKAFDLAEQRGRFDIQSVSPADAARTIEIPVLLIHGALDTDTPPDHSRRVFERLRGPKELLIVDGARHNESLARGSTWDRLTRWLDAVMATP